MSAKHCLFSNPSSNQILSQALFCLYPMHDYVFFLCLNYRIVVGFFAVER